MSNLMNELVQCDRETGLSGSFEDFVKIAWPQVFPASPLTWNWHLSLLCSHYEAVFRGEIRELVVNIPPGMSKSSLTSVLFPAWGWVRQPASRWIFAAYGVKLVNRDARYFRDLIRSKWFLSRWGDRFALPNVPPIGAIENDKKGFRFGTTPGAEVTGWHANYQVIDDPNKPEELTKVGLEGVVEWEARTMGTRWMKPPAINALVLIMQRLHMGDLAQTILDRGAVHVCLPAQFDPARRCVTTWGKDPRTKRGELLDPVRLPEHEIKRLRRNLGPINAAAQLDQSPVPEGGAVFKREWLQFWSTSPRVVSEGVDMQGVKYKCVDAPLDFDQRIASWDMAFKDEETSDYVAGQIWDRVGAHFFLKDQDHGHKDLPTSAKAAIALGAKWRGCTAILIEDKANGTGVIQIISALVPGVIPVEPKGGKFSRASACTGLWEAGNVFLPDPGMPGYEWVLDLVVEILTFPRAKKDDQVDAMTQGLLYLQENTSYLKDAMQKVEKWLAYDPERGGFR